MEAGLSRCRGHVELTRQKNTTKLSDRVKGKRGDAGFHWQAEGLRDHVAEAEKGKQQGGTLVVASCPALLPQPVCLEPVPPRGCFLLESSQIPASMAAFLPWVCRGPFCAFFTSGTLSLPGSLLGVTPPQWFLSLCGSPQSIKSSFVTQKEIDTLFSKMAILFHIQQYMRSPVFLHPRQHLGRSLPNLSYMGVRYPFKYLNFNGF